MPLLYTYRRCPYAMRARMALLVAGRAFEAHEIVLRDKPAALLAASPKGTVPVLCLNDGRVIDESWAIMAWALVGEAAPGWWARAQSAENLALLAGNDGPFKQHLDRYKYPERHGNTDRWLHRAQAAELLQALNARLGHSAQLGGATPCATDIAVFPFVRQFAAVEPAWFAMQPWPALQHWLTQWLATPLFAAAMARLPSQQTQAFAPLAGR